MLLVFHPAAYPAGEALAEQVVEHKQQELAEVEANIVRQQQALATAWITRIKLGHTKVWSAFILVNQAVATASCCHATRATFTSASSWACRMSSVSPMELITAQKHPIWQFSAFPDSRCLSCRPRPSSWCSASRQELAQVKATHVAWQQALASGQCLLLRH